MGSHMARDLYGPGSNVAKRYIRNNEQIAHKVQSLRQADESVRVVLTMGTYDLTHVGHFRYLERAKQHGDLLIVGVDSDAKTKARKGPHRPVVPEDERIEILAHSRHVDLITLKDHGDAKWQLIKLIKPDVLIATKETYRATDLEALKEYCKAVVVLEPQAETSTTARIRNLVIEFADKVRERFNGLLERMFGLMRTDASAMVDELVETIHGKKTEAREKEGES